MATIKDQRFSLVVLGNFNPMIFHPEWLFNNQIISESVRDLVLSGDDSASVEILVPQVAVINLPNMRLEVQQERLALSVLHSSSILAHDFLIKVLSILNQTPCSALGINSSTVFAARSHKQWHRFGSLLAPKEPWAPFLLDDLDDLEAGGLRTMTMERSKRPDGKEGFLRVKVSASADNVGETHIDINDHFSVRRKDQVVETAKAITEILLDEWDASVARSIEIVENLIQHCEEQDV